MEEKNAEILVHRQKKLIAAPMTAVVMFDGEEAGRLKNGESLTLNTTLGEHMIFIYVNGEKKCGGIFTASSEKSAIVVGALMHGWNMYMVGASPLARSHSQNKESSGGSQSQDADDVLHMTPTQKQIYIAKYGKRALKKAMMEQMEREGLSSIKK